MTSKAFMQLTQWQRMAGLATRLRQVGGVVSVLVLKLTLSACASFQPSPVPPADPPGQYQQLTLPIVVVGDSQEHLSTGFPIHDNDSALDALVEVTQRPPEQPLFGRRLLEYALQRHPGEPYLHMGDLLDISCRVEAARVAKVLQSTPQAGAILPGNHDGLMFGIFGYSVRERELDDHARHWARACKRGATPDDRMFKSDNEAFSKRDFIAHYLNLQKASPPGKPGLPTVSLFGNVSVSWRSSDPEAFLSAVEAKLVDGRGYATSFVAQRLKLPKAPGATRDVVVIGLDTNQSDVLVNAWDTLMGRSPGSVGHIHPDQFLAIEPWVKEAVSNGDILLFAGHHNWASLALPTRTVLRAIMGQLKHPLVYLSAHTHTGFWAMHRTLSQRPLLELNNSSLSDWPIAYRRVSVWYDEAANRLSIQGDLMPKGGRTHTSDADLMAAWVRETCEHTPLNAADIEAQDLAVVQQQRRARGSLVGWLLSAIEPECDTCAGTLYEHGHSYQDAMIRTLLQATDQASQWRLHLASRFSLPPVCGTSDFRSCALRLLNTSPLDQAHSVQLFRQKAALVAALNDELDQEDDPMAKAYMACRAVVSAKLDYDDTPDDNKDQRGEASRHGQHFFRTQATVGME